MAAFLISCWSPRLYVFATMLAGCSTSPTQGALPPSTGASSANDASAAANTSSVVPDASATDMTHPSDGGDPCSAKGKPGAQSLSPHSGHSENVPPEYAARLNPFAQLPEVIAAGAKVYKFNCVSCHGEIGRGDGPEWNKYHPRPAAFTALTDHSDSSMLWRVSESGWALPLCSAMPGYKGLISENDRWRLIAFLRTLGETPPFDLDAGATPLAPSMVSVNVVGQGIHAAWLLESACDAIDVLRSADGGPDVTIASLVANASTHNDSNVTHEGVYCYRTQCVWAGRVSPPSAALCASHASQDGGIGMDAMPMP